MQRVFTLALAAALLAPGTVRAQQEITGDTLRWSKPMQSGGWLRVFNMNGEITVQAASGNEAEVVGIKHYRRGDPEDVKFLIMQDGNDVTICALWGTRSHCDMEDMDSHWNGGRDDDVSVEFTVKLPRGVKIGVSSVNGAVSVTDAAAEVDAHTVNGRVEVATSTGPVSATTVNGGVVARMSALPNAEDMQFSTVNGSVRVVVPAEFDADVEMSTVNGRLRTDFQSSTSTPRHLQGVLGDAAGAGGQLTLKTVNGSVELEKQS